MNTEIIKTRYDPPLTVAFKIEIRPGMTGTGLGATVSEKRLLRVLLEAESD
jgi:hypothetical protein